MGFNIEKKTKFWIGLFVTVMALVYILVSFGKADWIRWTWVIWGFFLVALLFTEAGVAEYFKSKGYRSIGVNDILVIVTVIVASVLLINSLMALMALTAVDSVIPEWLSRFYTASGAVTGVIASVLGIFYMFTGKIRA